MYAFSAAQAQEPFMLEGPGHVTFESLGWTEDVLLTGAAVSRR